MELDFALAQADAQHDRALAGADAGRAYLVAHGQAFFAQESTRAAAMLAAAATGAYGARGLPRFYLGDVVVAAEGRAAAGPADFVGQFDERSMSGGYFTGLVEAVQLDQVRMDELGYTNAFDRFVGENLVRPLIGDDALAHATDFEIVAGVTGAVGGAVGKALGGIGQLVGRTALGGRVMASPIACKIATVAVRTAGSAQGVQSIANGVQNLREGNLVEGAIQIAAGALGLRGANRFSACFVIDTLVFALPEHVTVADAGPAPDDGNSSFTILVGLGVAVGALAYGIERRRRNKRNGRDDRVERQLFDGWEEPFMHTLPHGDQSPESVREVWGESDWFGPEQIAADTLCDSAVDRAIGAAVASPVGCRLAASAHDAIKVRARQ